MNLKYFQYFFSMILSTLLFGIPFHALHLNCPVNRDLFSIKYIPTRCHRRTRLKDFQVHFPWPRAPATWSSRVPFISYTRGTALAHPSIFGNAVIFDCTPLSSVALDALTYVPRTHVIHTTDDTRRG